MHEIADTSVNLDLVLSLQKLTGSLYDMVGVPWSTNLLLTDPKHHGSYFIHSSAFKKKNQFTLSWKGTFSFFSFKIINI